MVYFRQPVSLRSPNGGPSGLFLDIIYLCEIVEMEHHHTTIPNQFQSRMYQYRLLDHDQRELLVYHWQPGPDFAGPDHPHLHVSAALTVHPDAVTRRRLSLDKIHLVTGQVWPPSVIRMVITELGVAPQRPDWSDVLDRAEASLTEMITV
jgi:hypothetical protein